MIQRVTSVALFLCQDIMSKNYNYSAILMKLMLNFKNGPNYSIQGGRT